MLKEIANPATLVGTFKTFGPTGPAYEVVGVGREIEDDVMLMVRAVISGEEIEHPLSQVLKDPEA